MLPTDQPAEHACLHAATAALGHDRQWIDE